MLYLKRMVRNKSSVEGSIREAYVIEEISSFCSYYFEPEVQIRLTRVPRNDDGGDVMPSGCLSIFSHPRRLMETIASYRLMTDEEYDATHIYVLLNCEELGPFIE